MSYVSPNLREKFETLSIGLKNRILESGASLYTVQDLIDALEKIVKEDEEAQQQKAPANKRS